MSKELGKVLQQLRKHCELTQKQVAEALHIDRSTYAYYEAGATEPDLKSIGVLARIFNVDPKWLLPGEDGKFKVNVADVAGEDVADSFTEEELDLSDEKIYSLSKEERSFVVWMRTLSAEQKAKLKGLLQDEE